MKSSAQIAREIYVLCQVHVPCPILEAVIERIHDLHDLRLLRQRIGWLDASFYAALHIELLLCTSCMQFHVSCLLPNGRASLPRFVHSRAGDEAQPTPRLHNRDLYREDCLINTTSLSEPAQRGMALTISRGL